MPHLIFAVALTAVLSTQDKTLTSGSPVEEKTATRSSEPVRRSESPSTTTSHAQIHQSATPSSNQEAQGPRSVPKPAFVGPRSPQPPHDFKAALRQHLKNQGEPLNPEEFEQMLSTLEDIRSAVGSPALWPSDLPVGHSVDQPLAKTEGRRGDPLRNQPQPERTIPLLGHLFQSTHPGQGTAPLMPQHSGYPHSNPTHPRDHAEVTYIGALRDSARRLDQAAADLEEQSKFDEADRLREHAQRLRIEARASQPPSPDMKPVEPPKNSSVPLPFRPGTFRHQAMIQTVIR